MKAHEAVEFAKCVDERDRLSQAEVNRELVLLLVGAASKTAKASIVAELLRKAEHFRDADAPGHRPWYAHQLQLAAAAAELFGMAAPPDPSREPWASEFSPGDRVTLRHHSRRVEATLVRKKAQPRGAWIVRKDLEGVGGDSAVSERVGQFERLSEASAV